MNFTSDGERNLTTWIKNKKICFKKGSTSTLEYLQTINQDCDKENTCQYYFCKKKNNKDNICPITDIKINFGFDPGNYNHGQADKNDPSSHL